MRRFEFSEGSSHKFWQLTLSNASFTVQWGRIGSDGQTQVKDFASAEKAKAEHDKLVAEKLKKGYVEKPVDAAVAATPVPPVKPSAPKASAAKLVAAAPPTPAPTPATIEVCREVAPNLAKDGVVWTAAALRQVAPRFGSDLVAVTPPDAVRAWARIRARFLELEPLIRAGLAFERADHVAMNAACAVLRAEGPPTDLEIAAQAAAFALVAGRTDWRSETVEKDFVELWSATAGPAFVLRTLRAASKLFLRVEPSSRPTLLALVPEDAAQVMFRRPSPSDDLWRALRSAVLRAAPGERGGLQSLGEELRRGASLGLRVLLTVALEREDWAIDDLAEVQAQTSAASPNSRPSTAGWLLALMLPSDGALVEHLPKLAAQRWNLVSELAEVRFDLVARHGSGALPALLWLLDAAARVGTDRLRELAEALALVASPRAAERFATELGSRELRGIASEYLQRVPALALPPLAARVAERGAVSGPATTVLRAILATEAGQAALRDGGFSPRVHEVVSALQAANTARPEATEHELPKVLATPPWTRERVEALPAIELEPIERPTRLEWEPGEQERVKRSFAYLQPNARNVEGARRALAELVSGIAAPSRYLAATAFAQVPDDEAIHAFNTAPLEQLTWYSDIPTLMLARHGQVVLPGIFRLAEHQLATAMEALSHVDAPQVAPHMARASKLKSFRAAAATWLNRHPESAVAGLLPAALGPRSTARSEAEDALRFLAADGHRAPLESAADAHGAEVGAALRAVLDLDPLQLLPKKLPKLPAFFTPLAFTRPLLRGREKALPERALMDLGTMLALSDLDTAYAGVEEVERACDAASLAEFAWDLFQAWLTAGAPSKEAWAFAALGHLGDDDSARRLTPLIRTWPGEAAHGRAVSGLDVLARIGTDVALMHLHGIAQKVKFKGLQERAKEKIQLIAELRGLGADELADRLVPDLGLDARGTLDLDFGARQFKVVFDETMKPAVVGEDGKRASELPKPRQADDAEKAAVATATWKALKKDAKTVAQTQLMRLELAMCAQRRWTAEVFQRFIVEHPLLIHVARRLVWGVFDDAERPTATFRLAEDASLADIRDDAFQLGGDARVGIVHRLELRDEDAAAWGQIFGDYEILQPFEQLGRSCHRRSAAEQGLKSLDRVKGVEVPTGKVLGLDARGWRRGPPQDGGVVCWYEKRVAAGSICLDLDPGIFTGMLSESPQQKLGAVTLSTSGGWFTEESRLAFDKLNDVAYSELIRDLESLRS